MSIKVINDKCIGCEVCIKSCPFGIITMVDKKAVIGDGCTLCGACTKACKFEAIIITREEKTPQTDLTSHKNIWVFAEQRHGEIASVAFELLGEGRKLADKLGEKLCAVLIGDQIKDKADILVHHGADIVYVAQSPALKTFNDEPYSQVFVELANKYKPNIILIGASTIGRSLAPRVSARLETGLTADCTSLEIDTETRNLKQTRPAFGGNIMGSEFELKILAKYFGLKILLYRKKVNKWEIIGEGENNCFLIFYGAHYDCLVPNFTNEIIPFDHYKKTITDIMQEVDSGNDSRQFIELMFMQEEQTSLEIVEQIKNFTEEIITAKEKITHRDIFLKIFLISEKQEILQNAIQRLQEASYNILSNDGLELLQKDMDLVVKTNKTSVEKFLTLEQSQKLRYMINEFLERFSTIQKWSKEEFTYEAKILQDGRIIVVKYKQAKSYIKTTLPTDIKEQSESSPKRRRLQKEKKNKRKLEASESQKKRKLLNPQIKDFQTIKIPDLLYIDESEEKTIPQSFIKLWKKLLNKYTVIQVSIHLNGKSMDEIRNEQLRIQDKPKEEKYANYLKSAYQTITSKITPSLDVMTEKMSPFFKLSIDIFLRLIKDKKLNALKALKLGEIYTIAKIHQAV